MGKDGMNDGKKMAKNGAGTVLGAFALACPWGQQAPRAMVNPRDGLAIVCDALPQLQSSAFVAHRRVSASTLIDSLSPHLCDSRHRKLGSLPTFAPFPVPCGRAPISARITSDCLGPRPGLSPPTGYSLRFRTLVVATTSTAQSHPPFSPSLLCGWPVRLRSVRATDVWALRFGRLWDDVIALPAVCAQSSRTTVDLPLVVWSSARVTSE